MIFDRHNTFSIAQPITATAVSTDVIDFGATMAPFNAANVIERDIGKGNKPKLRIQVVQTFNNLTTLQVELQLSTLEAFGTPVVLDITPAVPLAQLVAGYVFPLEDVPRGALLRFMRLRYVVAGTAPTAGQITAGFVFGQEERDV